MNSNYNIGEKLLTCPYLIQELGNKLRELELDEFRLAQNEVGKKTKKTKKTANC